MEGRLVLHLNTCTCNFPSKHFVQTAAYQLGELQTELAANKRHNR